MYKRQVADCELIEKTLREILNDIEEGKITFSIEYEDIHMNIEKILIDRIGDVGKKLHTGRSRNDQDVYKRQSPYHAPKSSVFGVLNPCVKLK